jgi:hypothetical protein
MKIKLFSRQRRACRTPTLGGGVMVIVRTQQKDIICFSSLIFLLGSHYDPIVPGTGQTAGHTTCCREWTAERNLKAERLTHRLFWPPSNSR